MAEVNASDLQAFVVLQHAEIEHHRKRQANVFSMSTSIFFAIVGFLLVRSQEASCATFLASLPGKWVLTLLIVATAIFASLWQAYHYRAGNEHKQVIARVWAVQGISGAEFVAPDGKEIKLLHKNWDRWGDKSDRPCCEVVRHFLCSRQATTLYLGIFTVFVVWLV